MDAPHLDDACPDGEHVLVWDPDANATICEHCRLSSQTIVDSLGHDVQKETSDQ